MPAYVPLSTYRLQLSADFGFDDAAELAPYLKSLGISHLYTSPVLKARAGSAHGYDIVDHTTLNPEYGGQQAFDRLVGALKQSGIGLIIDFVPNHMGVGHADNTWWLDVLEWGQTSPYAASFDIDWEGLPYRHPGVLLPILGSPYGEALEKGEIELKYDAREGSFSAWYFDHRLPISPHRYSEILNTVVTAAEAADETPGRALLELAARNAGPGTPSRDDAPAFKTALAGIDGAAAVIERGLAAYRPSHQTGVATLHRLLERQHYRVAFWRVAVAAINYRRFFDINDLAGLRVEDPGTFVIIHELVAKLAAEGRLQGLRIDHIDGLWDPRSYARRLQHLLRRVRQSATPFYVVVEKILADGEHMPPLPGVAGTTGYEWLNVLSRVLVDAGGLAPLERLWGEIAGTDRNFRATLEQSKRQVLDTILASELGVLTSLLARIAAGHYSTRDHTIDRLRAALELFIVEFPIYRTYVTAAGATAQDRATIERAIAAARARWQGPDPEIFDFLRDALTLDLVGKGRSGYSKSRVRRFALKVQQFTGPVMAKALEDTAFYRHARLLALNEVGGNPEALALGAAEFHGRMAERVKQFRDGLTATATHDTKRGEDARARILALSELPDEWAAAVAAWQRQNASLVERSADSRRPSAVHEYMLYQTLLGAWPLAGPDDGLAGRMVQYAIKAAREGKVETSWINPNPDYEASLERFVRRMLDRQQSAAFLESFAALAERVALVGALNSLVQLALKATMPGVPDFYQGTELWDLSLVDPDNRRPVDFKSRTAALATLDATPDWAGLARHWPDGRIKLALTRHLLGLRNAYPAVFRGGAYHPLEVSGEDRDHVLAFARSDGRNAVIVAVGRRLAPMTDHGRRWPALSWNAALTLKGFSGLRDLLNAGRPIPGDAIPGGTIPVSRLFENIPVALLAAIPKSAR
ncbi:MAG: (1-_4)-alpha-D-glucan 1-alpha-D-glucosylmutase [Alphaproteobacteria bacterium]|nr:(1->4)-alpha-D-glucan 1-alpha-D-glucosylmutase [Alphaproteobacteria bacterium]